MKNQTPYEVPANSSLHSRPASTPFLSRQSTSRPNAELLAPINTASKYQTTSAFITDHAKRPGKENSKKTGVLNKMINPRNKHRHRLNF